MKPTKRKELILAVFGLIGFWWLLSLIVAQDILPNPPEVATAFIQELIHGSLIADFSYSLFRVTAGTLIAVFIATPIGLLAGQFKFFDRIISPITNILYPIPKVVFIPLIFLFTGIGEVSKILIIVIILFFQILVLVKDSAHEIRPELISSVRSLGAGRRGLLWFVYLPACLPPIFTAIRQSIGTSVAVLYFSELFATTHGLGYYIYMQGSTLFNYPAMYAGIIAMSFLGIGLSSLVNFLERKICPWKFER